MKFVPYEEMKAKMKNGSVTLKPRLKIPVIRQIDNDEEPLTFIETVRNSVWEVTEKVEQVQTQIVARDQAVSVEISNLKRDINWLSTQFKSLNSQEQLRNLKNQLDRLESSVGKILPFLEEKKKTNAHLNRVLDQLEDYLNQ